MLSQLALTHILGYPAIMYGGIGTGLLILFAALVGYRISRGKCKFKNPIKVHQTVALLSIILGLIHGLLGLAIVIGF